MAIARVGTVQEVQFTNRNSSASITVPSDAIIACIFVAGVSVTGTISLGGSAATRRTYVDISELWSLTSPSTGTQTLAWNFTGEGVESSILVSFYAGVDTAAPVRDADSAFNGDAGVTATTPSMTSVAGDMAVAGGTGWYGGATALVLNNNGQTAVYSSLRDYDGSNDGAQGLAEKLATTTTITMEAYGDYPAILAMVLKAAAAGGSIVPLLLHQYRARRQ